MTTELKFQDISDLRFNPNDDDHDKVYINNRTVQKALIIDGKLKATGVLRNVDLPIKEDEEIRYFQTAPSTNIFGEHEAIQEFISKNRPWIQII
jgi:hypothetical protein